MRHNCSEEGVLRKVVATQGLSLHAPQLSYLWQRLKQFNDNNEQKVCVCLSVWLYNV